VSPLTVLVSSWWGFAAADRTVVGIVVAAVGALAVAYVLLRLLSGRKSDGRGD
jgi:hypothetical protein